MTANSSSFKVSVLTKAEIADNTWELTLSRPEGFSFKAGQYLWLVDAALTLEQDPKGNRRAFSIASAPSDKEKISLIFRDTGSGYKKSLLAKATSSELEIVGPFGSSFVLENENDRESVIIAGGTGIAPFLSILRSNNGKSSGHKIVIFLNDNSKKAFYIEELGRLAKNSDIYFINKTGQFTWEDLPVGFDFDKALFYVCGPETMVNQSASILTAHKVPKNMMRFESSYPSSPNNLKPEDVEKLLSARNDLGILAIGQSNQHIIIADENGIILFANEAAQKITGYSLSEMKGNTPRLWGGKMSPDFYADLWQIKKSGQAFAGEVENRRKNGDTYYSMVHIAPIFNDEKQIIGHIATEEDITKVHEVNRMKTEFVALASHQLRTPLTAIKWLLELLISGEAGTLNDEQKKYLADANASNERMINLVSVLLDVSRIDSGKLSIEPKLTNLRKLVDELVVEVKPGIIEKGLKLTVLARPEIPDILVDPKLISEVYANLLSNAIKFTPEKGEISVQIWQKDKEIISQVTDSGKGIPAREQDRIFQKFYRGEDIVKSTTEGNGLGLYLAKAIVESSGGRIWFKSEEGKGTSFYFSLPVSPKIQVKNSETGET